MYLSCIWIRIIVNTLILFSISGIIYSDSSRKIKSRANHLNHHKLHISKMSTRHEVASGSEFLHHFQSRKFVQKSKSLELNATKKSKSVDTSKESNERGKDTNQDWFKFLLNTSNYVNSKDTVIPKEELFWEATRMIENLKESDLSGLPKSRNNRNRLTHHNDFIEKFLDICRLTKSGSHSKRGEGPQLSVVSPLDVLRQRFMLEMARRKIKENKDQIQANAEILKNLGKRSIPDADLSNLNAKGRPLTNALLTSQR